MVSFSVPFLSTILMTTVTKQTLSDTLSARINKISKGDRDLIERDRQSSEQSCLRSHCKRVWQQLTSKERDAIRHSIKKETTFFDRFESTDFLLESHCIKRVEELIQESGSFPLMK